MRLLRSLPPPAFQLLRLARTVALRFLSPADQLARFVSGRRRRPPLWLRRHAGRVSRFESAAREMAEVLGPLRLFEPDDLVLDIGCGAGAMAVAFQRGLGPRGRYLGLDLHGPSIRWCQEAFRADSRLRFQRVDRGAPLPASDGEVGFVLAKSLFTHLRQAEARGMLREIRRVLVPGRMSAATAFLFERGEGEHRCARDFPFARPDGSARWRWKARPESGVAFARERFVGMIQEAGLCVDWFVPGFWPGTERPRGQDLLLLSKGSRPTRLPCPRSLLAPKTP